MLSPLSNRIYRRMFAAQVLSLLGTGLTTVALGLLAFELAGADAGAVLGTALFLKMIAYVALSPLASAVEERLPRRAVLIGLDIVRAAIALMLPFVTQVWQIYALIFLLQTASAAFTPAFQASIPDVLEDEEEYTRALSLSRLAYDLESLISPMLAAALLLVIPFHWLFAGNALGFVASALLVMTSGLPDPTRRADTVSFRVRATRGLKLYLATPRLRGLLSLNLSVACAGAFVIVNTVVIVRANLGLGDVDLAVALAAYGAGSMIVALALPGWLTSRPDRGVMILGAIVLAVSTLVISALVFVGNLSWGLLLVLWFVLGCGNSAVLTPAARLLRRSVHKADRGAIFAAQFALSHACWLLAYPLAGWGGASIGLAATAALLGVLAVAGCALALRVWPAGQDGEIAHAHPDLPSDHPHLRGGGAHRHEVVIDALHPTWPR